MTNRDYNGRFIKGHGPVSLDKIRLSIKRGFDSGRVVWNKGKKMPKEVGQKIAEKLRGRKQSPELVAKRSSSNMGKKRTEEFKLRQSQSMSGERNHRWRGGVSTERMKESNQKLAREWRKKVFERDNYTCRVCGKHGGKLNADHIVPYFKNKTLFLDINNGQTLCVKCHLEKTRKEMRENWKNQYSATRPLLFP